MTSHQWHLFLFCCPPPDRSAYGYWKSSPAADSIIPVIEPTYSQLLLPGKEAKWVIGEKDGYVFFGRHGLVEDVMGQDYPAATDRVGRRLEFFLGYSAPAGTPLPRVSDFGQIETTMKADIERFYAEFSSIYPASRNITLTPSAFNFSGTLGEATSDHAWDKMASEIEGGKKSTLLVITQQGEVQTQDLSPEPTPRNDDRSSHTPREGPEQKKTGEPSDRRSHPSSSGQSTGYSATTHASSRSGTAPAFDGGKTAIVVSLCTVLAGGIAALLYRLRQKKDRQKAQVKGRNPEALALISGNKEHSGHLRQ